MKHQFNQRPPRRMDVIFMRREGLVKYLTSIYSFFMAAEWVVFVAVVA